MEFVTKIYESNTRQQNSPDEVNTVKQSIGSILSDVENIEDLIKIHQFIQIVCLHKPSNELNA